MNNTVMAFILTLLAGLSTMIGTIFIFIKNKNTNNIVLSSLAFAAGVMICVSITDLIPESINLLNNSLTGLNIIIISFLAVLLGIIISMPLCIILLTIYRFFKDDICDKIKKETSLK